MDKMKTATTTDESGREYQREFSEMHPGTMYDEKGRLGKARKTRAVILDAMRKADLDPCGRGAGYRMFHGDSDPTLRGDIRSRGRRRYRRWSGRVGADEPGGGQHRVSVGDSMELRFQQGSSDVVTCTHIYEHVPDAQRMWMRSSVCSDREACAISPPKTACGPGTATTICRW